MAEASRHLELESVSAVTFYVGPEKVVFYVHENLLCDVSNVFKAAFSGHSKEASARSMLLPNHNKDSVGRMVEWLYTGKFGLTIPTSIETIEECLMQLAQLNTLPDQYDIHPLKNLIVDDLITLAKPPRDSSPPRTSVISYIYNNTIEGSSFRKLLVAWHAYSITFRRYDGDDIKNELAEAPQEFTIDLVMALAARLKYLDRSNPLFLPHSVYYETPRKKI